MKLIITDYMTATFSSENPCRSNSGNLTLSSGGLILQFASMDHMTGAGLAIAESVSQGGQGMRHQPLRSGPCS